MTDNIDDAVTDGQWIYDGLRMLTSAITPRDAAGCHGPAGGYVTSHTEAVVEVAASLVRIANAIEGLSDAVRNGSAELSESVEKVSAQLSEAVDAGATGLSEAITNTFAQPTNQPLEDWQ